MLRKVRDVIRSRPLEKYFDDIHFQPGITKKFLGIFRRESKEDFFNATDDQLRAFALKTATTTYVQCAYLRWR